MVKYRRHKPVSNDSVFFLTFNTFNRKKWLSSPELQELAKQEMQHSADKFDVNFRAWVILPDHFHWLIKPSKSDYSKMIAFFKREVNIELKRKGIIGSGVKIWQPRFWEHTVRSDEDLKNCVEYIHFNPVKHGYVKSTHEWEYSSFHKYVQRGIYEKHWAEVEVISISGAEYD
ncbi:transposase [bacterium]|nr:transposase [bacterium]